IHGPVEGVRFCSPRPFGGEGRKTTGQPLPDPGSEDSGAKAPPGGWLSRAIGRRHEGLPQQPPDTDGVSLPPKTLRFPKEHPHYAYGILTPRHRHNRNEPVPCPRIPTVERPSRPIRPATACWNGSRAT